MAALSGHLPSLVFIGFMGAGKSKAARAAGSAPIDTDALLAAEAGMTIAALFEREGEAEARRREEAVVLRALDSAAGAPIALGGGSVVSARVREALARHTVAYLEIEADEAWGRVEGSDRPLARDPRSFAALLSERRPIYESLADAVVPARREVVKRALPALLALRELPAGSKLAWARSASGEYPVFVGPGLLDASPLGKAAAHGEIGLGGRPFCVTDENVAELYSKRVEPVAARIALPPGEEAKTLASAERVWRELAAAGMTRSDHIVALGGGVVGDLAGFCAATYQRGVPVVHLPTTLVAQVDSAYGGKTGVDLPEAKNYVGAYHQPAAVIADPTVLSTLPREELAAGFVEVLKTALIAGGSLWERGRGIDSLRPAGLEGVIFACARTKLAVVAADERDAGRRQVLNLGHTVGHAIETATAYGRYRHGEAVGLGLLAALRLSEAEALRDQVEALLGQFGLPTRLDPAVDADAVIAALARDKKRTNEGLGFVLCAAPGGVTPGHVLDPDTVRSAVEELR